ncbi:MAG: hypothetical protein OXR73_07950 [Myxococcales bacterium]|nr:hypothetical protein [Myxococcales bacterium]
MSEMENIKRVDGWFNILDPGFNLHLREDGVDRAWVVRKPTGDGEVTSLEIYDTAGDMIAYLFSMREHGQQESAAWRSLLAGLPCPAVEPSGKRLAAHPRAS